MDQDALKKQGGEAAVRYIVPHLAKGSVVGVGTGSTANCFIDVECLRLNAYQAAGLLAAGNDATTEVQIAKIWAADVGHRVSYASQHMHGGTGIDRDYPLWRFCLFARHNELMRGGASAQLSALGDRIAAGQAGCH